MGIYKITNVGANKCLNISGNNVTSLTNNQNVTLWSDSGTNEQKWDISSLGTGVYIKSVINTAFGLNVYRNSALNCDVYPIASNSTKDCQMNFIASGSNYKIRLTDTTSGTLYLTADGSANVPNVYWAVNSTSNYQLWALSSVSSGGSGGGSTGQNYATYPCKYMRITQKYDGTASHIPNSTGTPYDYPTDEACEDTGRSWMYCPCDEMEVLRLSGVGNSSTNTIWLKSTSKVYMPCGYDYLVMMVIHPLDDDLGSIRETQKFTRGQAMFREGNDGNATGHHFHISLGTGNGYKGNGWTQNSNGAWVLTPIGSVIKIEQGFYLDTSFTTVMDKQGISFTSKP